MPMHFITFFPLNAQNECNKVYLNVKVNSTRDHASYHVSEIFCMQLKNISINICAIKDDLIVSYFKEKYFEG